MCVYCLPLSPSGSLRPCPALPTPTLIASKKKKKNLRNSNSQKYLGKKAEWRPGKGNRCLRLWEAPIFMVRGRNLSTAVAIHAGIRVITQD